MRNRKHDIEKYLRGELSPAEMHALEKEALSDPFLAEALEGIDQAGADNFLYDLHRLNRSVHDRTRRKGRKSKVVRMWGWTSAVAATLLLLAVSGFLVVKLLRDQQSQQQAMEKNRPVSPPDSSARTTDSLKVTTPPASPLAAVEEKKEPEQQRPRRRATEGKQPSADSRAETAKPDEVTAQQDVTPREGFIAEEELAGDKAAKDVESATEEPALADNTRSDAALSAKQKEVARALEGKTAGVDAKRSMPGAAVERPSAASVVTGKVTASDGSALPGVNVLVDGSSTGTVTDVDGSFQLAVPQNNPRLQFAFIGFQSKVVDVAHRSEVNVMLDEDVAMLSEVVVTGYATRSSTADPPAFRFAEPEGGRSGFKDYLSLAVKYPDAALTNKTEGRVTVRFTVEPSGQLTNFEVVRGIGAGCDEELIRAIREGPAWKPSSRDGQPVSDKVSVRYRFKVPD
jgi:TonB family protein